MTETLFVYGTLRPGNSEPVFVKGTMHSLGWFPGVFLDDKTHQTVVCEAVPVSDWDALDRYEGYNPDSPETSLYVRQRVTATCGRPEDGSETTLEGWIYVYNNKPGPYSQVVESGDWLAFTGKTSGSNATLATKAA